MIINIAVGLIFAGIIAIAARKAYKDAKNGKCSCGSSGSCSSKSKCGNYLNK